MYRQGDVLLIPVKKVPTGADTLARENGRIVLALGEATGHAHAVDTLGAELLTDHRDRYLSVPSSGASLVHEEHGMIALPEGTYRIVLQREYSPREIRRVAD